ncbi:MAG: hypothetical protein ABSG78_18270 [Verrucomicrobiota bacterium]|jgi:hypothetical protein
MQFQQKLNRKELSTPKAFGAREHRDKTLWFFFAIFAFFVVNSALVAACRGANYAPFCGNSIQMPFHEPFTHQTAPFPIKLGQA